jgi:hypothetical protein
MGPVLPSPPTSQLSSRPGFLARHPIALSALLAATGAVAALPFATLLSALASVLLGDYLLPSKPSPDYAEGLGYLVGFYCVIMFPVGAAVLGLVTGAAAHAVRPIHDEPPNPVVPLAVGIAAITLVTLGLSIAAVFLFIE